MVLKFRFSSTHINIYAGTDYRRVIGWIYSGCVHEVKTGQRIASTLIHPKN